MRMILCYYDLAIKTECKLAMKTTFSRVEMGEKGGLFEKRNTEFRIIIQTSIRLWIYYKLCARFNVLNYQ